MLSKFRSSCYTGSEEATESMLTHKLSES
ncbi:hypothetical protein VTO73DRAFT_2032 [Trametes versicolor]